METIMFVLTLLGTIATIWSTILAVSAKNEAKNILKQITYNNSIETGNQSISNKGKNSGVITNTNTGEINNERH